MANGTEAPEKKRPQDDEDEERRGRYAPGEAETIKPIPGSATTPVGPGTIPAVGAPKYGSSDWLEQRAKESEARQAKWNAPPSTTLGKIFRPLRNIGYVAGEVMAPSIIAATPGTPLHEQLVQGNIRREIPGVRREEALTQEAKERTDIERQRLGLEAYKAGQPEPTGKKIYGPNGEEMNEYKYQTPEGPVLRYVRPGESPMGEGAPPAAQIPGMPGQKAAPPSAAPSELLPPVRTPAEQPPAPLGAPTPPARAAAPPPGYTTNQLSAEQREEKRVMDLGARVAAGETLSAGDQQFLDANQAKYQNKLAIGPRGVAAAQRELAGILRNTQIPPGTFRFEPNMTAADKNALLHDARDMADRERGYTQQEAMVDKRQEEKDRTTTGYAVNPKNGNLELTDKYTADKVWKADFEPMGHAEITKERGMMRRLDDVQKNVSEYTAATNAMTTPVEHYQAMQRIIAGVNESDVQKMGYLTLGGAMDLIEQGEVAKSWQELSKPERALMIGYLRAKGAMIAYNAVISGSARPAVEQLKVEWQNLPVPYVGATVANDAMRSVQDNIDIASRGYPTNLPGMPSPRDIRREVEGPGPVKPPPGARVRKYNQETGRLE